MQMKPNDEMLDNMITRFEAGKSLDKRYFILPQRMVRDNQDIYFCYESFDHNLETLMAAVVNGHVTEDEWRKVVIGCIKALHYLHETNISHGHITSYNLVRSNSNGYLMGGVGNIFTPKMMWNAPLRIDPLKHDVKCLVEVIYTCIPPAMNVVELTYLLEFLKFHTTMKHIQYHPYIQSSTGVVALFVSAWEVLHKDCSAMGKSYGDEIKKYIQVFENVMKSNKYTFPPNWKGNIPPNSTLSIMYNDSDSSYHDNVAGLFKFWRNVFTHAKKGTEDTVEQHHDALYNMLNTVWPGFAHM
ncbi:hypothetical protein PIB30_109173, partial [Stylosanthes scabra]|nr:hypothetical protein [Stylosanthes scabra]